MKKLHLIFIFSSILFSEISLAKIVYYGSQTETLTIAYDASTILRFDEEVKTISQVSRFIIAPADPKDPSYRLLSIKPRYRRGVDNVTFILANDSVVNLKIKTVASNLPEKTDSFYDLKAKDLKVDPLGTSSKGSNVSELELMKAMIRSDKLIGYNTRSLIRTVNTGIKGITARLVKIYTGPKFNGYIFEIKNTCKETTYAIDLKSLTLGRPNVALLSQVDEKFLHPKKSKGKGKSTTFLRIVAKPTSVYYNITLPVAPISKK